MIDINSSESAAVLAVRVSKEIDGAQYDSAAPAVRARGAEEAELAVHAAKAAHEGGRIAQIEFATLVLGASYDSHGARLDLALDNDSYALDESTWEMKLVAPSPVPEAQQGHAQLVQPIVRVRCSSAVDDLAAITVLGSIDAQLRELADAHFVSLSDTVFIVEQP